MTKKSQFLPKIEYEIALLLIKKLLNQQLNEESCSNIAKKILELLPIPENISDNKLQNILPKLKEIYPELELISIKYLNLIDEEIKKEKIEQIKQKINYFLHGSIKRNQINTS